MDYLKMLGQTMGSYYTSLEDFIIKDEISHTLKIKKKVALFVCCLMAFYGLLLPVFNPFFSIWNSLTVFLSVIGIIVLLRVRNCSFVFEVVFLTFGLVAIHMSIKNSRNTLRMIGILLCQHNQALLLSNNKVAKIIFIIGSIFIVNKIQTELDVITKEENVIQLIDLVKNFQYSWPLMYFFNHYLSYNIVKEYCKALETGHQSQEELKIKNKELFILNEKLKTTLSILEDTNKELKEAIKARELFIASVSHELRNPLNSLLGNVELLSLEMSNSKWLKMLENCKICGDVLLGLINNILDVAKINAERVELNCQPTNLYRLIEKVWVVSTIKMREKGLNGSLKIDRNVPKYIKMDPHRFNQILLNIIGNATKFTKTGFVKVFMTWHPSIKDAKIEEPNPEFTEWVNFRINPSPSLEDYTLRVDPLLTESNLQEDDSSSAMAKLNLNRNILQRKIPTKSFCSLNSVNTTSFNESDIKIQEKLIDNHLSTYKGAGILKIEIIDSGCGLSESSIQKLFQAFSQADSSITRRFGGTGLGLYITKQLIQKMGGQINVRSRENVGSDFLMTLPCQTATREEVEKSPCEDEKTKEIISTKSIRVLIVDDDPLNQMIMTNYFHKLNVQTDVANNGQEALAKVKAKEIGYYSLITMDLQMPVMDGLTACKEIRRFEKNNRVKKNVPIGIVSANFIDIQKNQWLDPHGEIKASHIFQKPFTFEECQSFLKTTLTHN